MNKFLPKKHLGQNFLIDRNIVDKIISSCDFTRDDVVLEIGPGLGALTLPMAERVKKIIAIETDARLCDRLSRQFQKSSNAKIVHADFLKYDISTLPLNIKVVGNLPYNISSAILGKIFENKKHFVSLFITVQLEFGLRAMAKFNTKDYSAFSCYAQYHAEAQMLFKIKNTCFKPVPKVNSCFLQFKIHKKFILKSRDEKFLFQIIRLAFQQRRKRITNALSSVIQKERLVPILNSLKISSLSRAENLSLENYVDLVNMILSLEKEEKHPFIKLDTLSSE